MCRCLVGRGAAPGGSPPAALINHYGWPVALKTRHYRRVAVNVVAIVAGVLLIGFRRQLPRGAAFSRVPVLRLFDRAARLTPVIMLVGVAWIALGVWGLAVA